QARRRPIRVHDRGRPVGKPFLALRRGVLLVVPNGGRRCTGRDQGATHKRAGRFHARDAAAGPKLMAARCLRTYSGGGPQPAPVPAARDTVLLICWRHAVSASKAGKAGRRGGQTSTGPAGNAAPSVAIAADFLVVGESGLLVLPRPLD